jgi:hypothetical protein
MDLQEFFNGLLAEWDKYINDAQKGDRYCDKSMGEDIGWFMTPYMDGFYYGYMATKDLKWIVLEMDWADSLIKRGVKEPDGYIGWPSLKAAGTDVDNLDSYYADSFLGDAMVLRPLVLTAKEILKDPALKAKYGEKAQGYIDFAEKIAEKWEKRGGWRETKDGGMISVTLPYGIDQATGQWDAAYATRNDPGHGFSHPNNKANHVARWMLAMYDATGKEIYKQRAEKWFKLFKSRITLKPDGTYTIWNYWQPAGPWDYKADGKTTKHWVGVHPNAGYYEIDLTGVVEAYQHGIVFTKADIEHFIATATAEKRYWSQLAPYSPEIQKRVEAGMKPASWGGLGETPWYLMLQGKLSGH